jgi:hypothetical protein
MRYSFGFLFACALSVLLLGGCGETVLCEGVVCEDDGNECTDDVCNPATGSCEHVTVEDETSCEFGELPGLCKAGVCVDAMLCEGIECEDDSNECTDDVCNPATGSCEHVTLPDDTECDFDGSPGLCKAGECVDAMLCEGVQCDDDNECTKDTCNPLTGSCANMPIEDGTLCTGGVCREGVCGPLCIANICHCSEAGIRAAIDGGGYYPYTFNCDGPTTVTTEREIEIDNDVILDGEGNLTVDGNKAHRVFSVGSGVAAELRAMTVTRGAASGDGGGIHNDGTLALTNTTVSSNTTSSDGGGIWNQGALTLVESTVSDNTAAESAGGIQNRSGTVELNRSTVSGNTTFTGGGGAIESGGDGALLLLINTTVSGNFTTPGRGAIENDAEAVVFSSTLQQLPAEGDNYLWAGSGWTVFRNSILNGQCAGPVYSDGGNIESPGDSCGLQYDPYYEYDWPSVPEAELNLGPLQDNGGPTLTHLPGPSSFAIDRIEPWNCVDANWGPLEIDQRGVNRPQGELCDVGSVEAPSLCEGVDCDDFNECTWDSCDPSDASCSYEPVPDGWYCELDGWPGLCIGGVCTEDFCAGDPCNDGNECTFDNCDPFTEECTNDSVPDDWYCSFDTGGTGGTGGTGYTPGICFEGECIENLCASNPCNDGNECTFDNCDPFTGQCTNDWVPDGWYCYLGNGGIGGAGGSGYPGICFEGECIEDVCAGNPCDDGNDCTLDSCSFVDGSCSYTDRSDGAACMNDTGQCLDGACELYPVCGAERSIPPTATTASGILYCESGGGPSVQIVVTMAASPSTAIQEGPIDFETQFEFGVTAETVNELLQFGVSTFRVESHGATIDATMGDSNPTPVLVSESPVPCIGILEWDTAHRIVTPMVNATWTLDAGPVLELTAQQFEETLAARGITVMLTTEGPGANCVWDTPPPAVSFAAAP